MKRMEKAGVVPITWNAVLAELQRDHAGKSTEHEVTRIFLEHLFLIKVGNSLSILKGINFIQRYR